MENENLRYHKRLESNRRCYANHRSEYLKQVYYKYNKKQILTSAYKRYKENKAQILLQKKDYYKRNRDTILKLRKINSATINNYRNNRKKTDLNYRLKCNMRARIWRAIKLNRKTAGTIKLLGCSIEKFKHYIEKQFTIGMSWNNYGKWHIDHIIPCCKFDLTKPEEQLKCFHYTNLQPLWAKENLQKSRALFT